MTSLIGARRRAEEFDAALRSRTPATGSSPEMDALLSVVETLRSHEAPAPRADFAADLRERLMAEAAEVLTPSTTLALPPRRRGARERRLTIAASALVLIGGTAGMAAAAQSSAPGDALYPLKRGLETAERALQRDDAATGQAFLSQAGARLDEARELVGRDATSREISSSLRSFSTQAMTGSDLLLDSYQEDRDPAVVRELRSFTADALASLDALAAVAPADLSEEIAQVGFVLQRIDAAAAEACTTCSDRPALQVPREMQLTAEVQRALEQTSISKPRNDHPAPAVTLPVSPAKTPAKGDGAPAGEPAPAPAPADGPAIGDKDLKTELPKNPKDLLDAVDDATGGLLGSAGETAGDLLPGDLGTTADSLLP